MQWVYYQHTPNLQPRRDRVHFTHARRVLRANRQVKQRRITSTGCARAAQGCRATLTRQGLQGQSSNRLSNPFLGLIMRNVQGILELSVELVRVCVQKSPLFDINCTFPAECVSLPATCSSGISQINARRTQGHQPLGVKSNSVCVCLSVCVSASWNVL